MQRFFQGSVICASDIIRGCYRSYLRQTVQQRNTFFRKAGIRDNYDDGASRKPENKFIFRVFFQLSLLVRRQYVVVFQYDERDKRINNRVVSPRRGEPYSGILVYRTSDDLSDSYHDDGRYGIEYFYRTIQNVYSVQQQGRRDRKHRLFPVFTGSEERRMGAAGNKLCAVHRLVGNRSDVDGYRVAIDSYR